MYAYFYVRQGQTQTEESGSSNTLTDSGILLIMQTLM